MSASEYLPVHVRNLERNTDGHWCAEVSRHGNHKATWLPVHCDYGSWMSGYGITLKDVLPDVAAELVRLVKKAKKRERNQAPWLNA